MTDYITPVAQPTPYLNTISNIHDYSSLIKFYELMFAGNPLILITVVFMGLYGGMVIYENVNKAKRGDTNDCNKN